jgi:hypothetical protein
MVSKISNARNAMGKGEKPKVTSEFIEFFLNSKESIEFDNVHRSGLKFASVTALRRYDTHDNGDSMSPITIVDSIADLAAPSDVTAERASIDGNESAFVDELLDDAMEEEEATTAAKEPAHWNSSVPSSSSSPPLQAGGISLPVATPRATNDIGGNKEEEEDGEMMQEETAAVTSRPPQKVSDQVRCMISSSRSGYRQSPS